MGRRPSKVTRTHVEGKAGLQNKVGANQLLVRYSHRPSSSRLGNLMQQGAVGVSER